MQDHRDFNQRNYSLHSDKYSEIKLDSTMYLAYRDLPHILQKHVLSPEILHPLRVLDYGCGPGVSTEMLLTIFNQLNVAVEVVGVDINEENIKLAKHRLGAYSNVAFMLIKKGALPTILKDFNCALCNFVLLENSPTDILGILQSINSVLTESGKLIVTNTTARVYYQHNQWYSLDNNFEDNKPQPNEQGKLKLKEGQPVKLKLHNHQTKSSFIVSDFFYSGKFYREAYAKTGYSLLGVTKPIARESDELYEKMKSEKTTPPYKIHVLIKNCSPSLTLDNPLRSRL